jgi:integrase
VDFPSKAEIRAMLAASVGARAHALITTAIFTGLRASELRGLRWCDVNFAENQIEVRQRADRFNQIGDPKSSAGVREIPMGPYVANTLRAWRPKCPPGPHDLVFPNGKGRIETLSTIRNRVLVPLQKSVGIESANTGPRYGMHSLRHAAASLWIEEHAPKRVQILMGHSTIALTFDTYGHLWPSPDETKAAKALEERLGLVSVSAQ